MKHLSSVITVLSARRYSFKDDSGREVDGVKIYYVEEWDNTERENVKGIEMLEATLPVGIWSQMSTGAADYNATFEMIRGAKGKAMLQVTDLQYVQDFRAYDSALVSPNGSTKGTK